MYHIGNRRPHRRPQRFLVPAPPLQLIYQDNIFITIIANTIDRYVYIIKCDVCLCGNRHAVTSNHRTSCTQKIRTPVYLHTNAQAHQLQARRHARF